MQNIRLFRARLGIGLGWDGGGISPDSAEERDLADGDGYGVWNLDELFRLILWAIYYLLFLI